MATRNRLMRFRAVLDATGEKRSTIYDKIRKDQFPKPVPIGPRAVAWIEAEIDEYIEAKIEQRGAA